MPAKQRAGLCARDLACMCVPEVGVCAAALAIECAPAAALLQEATVPLWVAPAADRYVPQVAVPQDAAFWLPRAADCSEESASAAHIAARQAAALPDNDIHTPSLHALACQLCSLDEHPSLSTVLQPQLLFQHHAARVGCPSSLPSACTRIPAHLHLLQAPATGRVGMRSCSCRQHRIAAAVRRPA
jgi:hypothetical protein